MTANNNQRERISVKPFILIAFAMITVLVMIYISASQGYRMTAKYSSLIDAAMEIKLEATFAHLWFEEIMSGDEKESIDKVKRHIEQSVWYANAMLEGGSNEEGTFIALDDESIRHLVEEVLVELEVFKSLTNERYENFVSSHPGSEIDIKYDETFNRFIESADIAEYRLQTLVREELTEFQQLHYLMAISVILIALSMVVIAWRHEQQNVDYLRLMHEAQLKLEELSNTDQLTGLANRRAFDTTMVSEFNRAMRSNTSLALLMMDVDFFKNYNDSYGHVKGDACLKDVSATVKHLCKRSLDIVARYGGEEFAVIMPNSENTLSLAEEMRKSVMNLAIPHKSSDVAKVVTISIGVAEIVPQPGMKPEELVTMADKALYRAKSEGRNLVKSAT